MYQVKKLTLSISDNSPPAWSESAMELTVRVEDTHFSSGVTKHVYKVSLLIFDVVFTDLLVQLYHDDETYAAKRFFNIGDKDLINIIPHDDNLKHLKEELLRQTIVRICTEKFITTCRSHKIGVYGQS